MKRYHVFACDYDGTLARHGRVDDATLMALEKVHDSGRRLAVRIVKSQGARRRSLGCVASLYARTCFSVCQPSLYSRQAARRLNSCVSTRRRTLSKTPCWYALLGLLANQGKAENSVPIFPTRRAARMCAAKFNRRNTKPRHHFRPPSTIEAPLGRR